MRRFLFPSFIVLASCALLSSIVAPLTAGPPPQEVRVINGAASPVPVIVGGTVVTAPAGNPTPIARIGILAVSAGGRQDRQTLFTVPTGKRLVIQSQTAVTQTTGGVKAQVQISANGGGFFYVAVPQVSRGSWTGQGEIYEGSSAVSFFADAGQTVEARVWLDVDPAASGQSARVEVGFSGVLVDVP